MSNRKVFDRLHLELSMAKGENIPRMQLWMEVGETCDPRALTKETAMELYPEVAKALSRWDPDRDTPEEIFERICGGTPEE